METAREEEDESTRATRGTSGQGRGNTMALRFKQRGAKLSRQEVIYPRLPDSRVCGNAVVKSCFYFAMSHGMGSTVFDLMYIEGQGLPC